MANNVHLPRGLWQRNAINRHQTMQVEIFSISFVLANGEKCGFWVQYEKGEYRDTIWPLISGIHLCWIVSLLRSPWRTLPYVDILLKFHCWFIFYMLMWNICVCSPYTDVIFVVVCLFMFNFCNNQPTKMNDVDENVLL